MVHAAALLRDPGRLAEQELIFTTEDHSGAALWTLPGRWREDLRQSLMMLPMLPVLLPRIMRSTRAVREIERHHPGAAALLPVGQQSGPTQTNRAEVLAPPCWLRLDRAATPRVSAAYLESSKASNVSFYAGHGFTVIGKVELPSGPPLWFMWREPRHPAAGRRAGS